MMAPQNSKGSLWFWAGVIICAAFLLRLVSLGLYPLMDTTEARYGEMARLMVETNDWITPYFDYGIPFWGKPPLFVWLSALSCKLFGVNEFAVRLPSLICSLGTLLLVWKLALFQMGVQAARLTILVLTTTAMFLVLSGAVLADPAMTFSITLILVGFWIGWNSNSPSQARLWQYLFFAGCGIALLAKGPVAVVLAGGSIFLWCLPKKRLITLWQKFPWVWGTLLAALIAVPWYVAAELKTPGFLEYFLIGEHFGRYLDSGWEGDEYGNAHVRAIGTIWIRLIQGGFPWSLVLLGIIFTACWKKYKKQESRSLVSNEWQSFLYCWLLFLPLFFTFTKNLIWTYALPVAPALALLIGEYWGERWQSMKKSVLTLSIITPILMMITVGLMMNDGGKKSQKYIMSSLKSQNTKAMGSIIYLGKRPFSARFYSEGKAILTETEAEIRGAMMPNKTDFLATRDGQFNSLSQEMQGRFEKVSSYRNWTLWKEKE